MEVPNNILDLYDSAKDQIKSANKILIIQGNNTDADSVSSSLAIECLLEKLDKQTYLYCGSRIPDSLRYIKGYDRIFNSLPSDYDLVIMVDCSAKSLINFEESSAISDAISSRPIIIFDHHDVKNDFGDQALWINDLTAISASQVIYEFSKSYNSPIPSELAKYTAIGILGDSSGFTNQNVDNNSRVFKVMAELIELGTKISELNEERLEAQKITPEVMRYKATLINRVEYFLDNQIAVLKIPHSEIIEFSQNYNPTLILDEFKVIKNLKVMLGIKYYQKLGNTYKITVRIRTTKDINIASKLAENFGGGGHQYAAGIKLEGNNLNLEDFKFEVVKKTIELLNIHSSSKD